MPRFRKHVAQHAIDAAMIKYPNLSELIVRAVNYYDRLVAQARRNRRVEEAAKLVVTAWEFGLAVPYGMLRTALKETADAN